MNGLDNLAASLESKSNEIFVAEELAARALLPLQRMLDFVKASA